MAVAKAKADATASAPRKVRNFWRRIRMNYRDGIAHFFLIVGNVRDTLPAFDSETGELVAYADLISLISAQTASKCVVVYDLAHGLLFPQGPLDKYRFIAAAQEVGAIPKPADPSQGDQGAASMFGNSLISQFAGLPSPQLPQEDPIDAIGNNPIKVFNVISKVLGLRRDTKLQIPAENGQQTIEWPGLSFIIDFGETILPNGDMIMQSDTRLQALIFFQKWARNAAIGRSNLIFLIAKDAESVHQDLRTNSSGIVEVEIPLPNDEERLAFIEFRKDQFDQRHRARREELKQRGAPPEVIERERDQTDYQISFRQLAALTSGLPYTGVEDVLLRAQGVGKLTEQMARERTDAIIRANSNGRLEPGSGKFTLDDVAAEPKQTLVLREVMRHMQEGKIALCPRGILLSGPPGTGKTVIAEAMAAEAGVKFVRWDISALLGKYVGESEANLRNDMAIIRAMAPVIVFIDEIDTAGFGRSTGGDSGVGSRILRGFLTEMSKPDVPGRILFLAATNRPDNLDAALMRPGRFGDLSIPILPLGLEGRKKVLDFVIRKKRGYQCEQSALDWLAEQTKGYAGAYLEQVAAKAIQVADRDGRSEVTQRDLETAKRSIYGSNAAANSEMTALALEFATDIEVVPEDYLELYLKKKGAQPLPTPEKVGEDFDDVLERARNRQMSSSVDRWRRDDDDL